MDNQWNLPLLTLIIRLNDKAKEPFACFEAIEKSEYPKNYLELFLISEETNEEIRKAICDVTSKYPDLKIWFLEGKSFSQRRQEMPYLQKGAFLFEMDSACTFAQDFLKKSVAYMEKHEKVGIMRTLEVVDYKDIQKEDNLLLKFSMRNEFYTDGVDSVLMRYAPRICMYRRGGSATQKVRRRLFHHTEVVYAPETRLEEKRRTLDLAVWMCLCVLFGFMTYFVSWDIALMCCGGAYLAVALWNLLHYIWFAESVQKRRGRIGFFQEQYLISIVAPGFIVLQFVLKVILRGARQGQYTNTAGVKSFLSNLLEEEDSDAVSEVHV